ncbi:uncharacterized protein LOC105203649 isoform X1 [Solenopsis invicta]|uniref:uncharacterized protein LOC105203649 isoform X1 n=1 Tax=Solenopsis invicta TaxID=13686 RepID=UPI00193DA2AD|nr:uncharacterized protein LOC105203649 isoform X1 [Solenopsis invicta]
MSRKLFDICRVMSRNSFDIATVIFLTSFTRRPSLADDKHSSDHSLLTDDGRRPSIIVDAGLLIMVTETRQLHTPDSSLYERLRPRRTSKKRKNLSSETWAVENGNPADSAWSNFVAVHVPSTCTNAQMQAGANHPCTPLEQVAP